MQHKIGSEYLIEITNLMAGNQYVINDCFCLSEDILNSLSKTNIKELRLESAKKGFNIGIEIATKSTAELKNIFGTPEIKEILLLGYENIKKALYEYEHSVKVGEVVIYKPNNTMCVCVKCERSICTLLSDEGVLYENVNIGLLERTGEKIHLPSIFYSRKS